MLTNDMPTDLHNLDNRMISLENNISNINATLIRFEKRFDNLDQEIKEVRTELKSDIKEVRTELKNDIRTNFFWSLGAFLGVLGLIAHAFKWI